MNLNALFGKPLGAVCGLVFMWSTLGAPLAASQPSGGPPLYMAQRGNAKVYLLGGANAQNDQWQTPQIRAALEVMTHLWEEDPPGQSVFNRQLNIDLGTRKGGSLYDDLTPAETARVENLAKSLGIDEKLLTQMRPWAAGAVIAAANLPRYMAANQPVGGGLQLLIQKMAADRGIPVTGEVEQWDDLVRFHAAFPKKAAVQYLMYQCDMVELPATSMPKWSEAWLHGDLSGWIHWGEHMRAHYPDPYAVMESNRNSRWAARIGKMLKEGGVHFISVGIAHTVGPDSIQAMAKRSGVTFKLVE